MNTKMYENPLTKKNLVLHDLATKKFFQNQVYWLVEIQWRGALADIDDIIESIDNAFNKIALQRMSLWWIRK